MKNNTVTAPKGFLAAGISCGIKQSGKKDIAILACPTGAKAAGVFTTNKVVSAAVTICKKYIKTGNAEAVIVNSGNANTCTGKLGLKNAQIMCQTAAQLIDAKANQVLVASTGIIGHQLPMEKITTGIILAAAKLSGSPKAGNDFAQAIMTTDTRCKQAFKAVNIDNVKITIAGTAKGAGMIGPNMATTLCFITTDAAITKALLQKALKDAVGDSINKLTVDGHQSTNDTAIILASGLAGNKPITKTAAQYKKFAAALAQLTTDLAKQMALDAEGATKMFAVIVNGAANKNEAAKAARAVADYDLVKCAIHGGDANWGRIICAVGSCGVKLNPKKLTCSIGNITVFKNGRPVKFDPKKVSKIIKKKEHTITINLGSGKFSDFCYGCDLSAGYVRINADYHT
ncbi:MAG: bifunctional glutamate N-acetyltransferase/amino-acid acetyltransferase ArgJ [Planctomycetes bacterium]|nr:bifunctional glutamate N-acetyltransferase/amino-acid acetyltransferase ArgJ [Planctomycetota bacterium]MBU1517521.1 bifunctional glutamate N-acetyltransferase/amino-acid acetyltransferase ArgJ [Planctomycetota bacterium]MBU2457333.1 bifunctional glutamate N-acetyltransferase/amino-acid acetyltransferase ArgJ [Planctomycetota bacterium]MBU2596320.1 bifunctional glutamate N-acetyltransferase/amino-acid acetyltransferase ArgJ [Planctomycetota bacterium]